MANVSVTSTQSNISVNTSNNTVAVTSTPTTVLLSTTAAVSNASVRTKIDVQNVSGFGNLAYDNSVSSNGIIQYTGVSTGDIRGQFSNTAPITYDSSTGVFGLEQTLDDLTLVKYQETVINNGNISGNVAFDISTGTIHTGTLTGNITDIALTNISSGGSATLILTQDAFGAKYLDTTSGFTNWRFVGNTSSINGAVNATSVISLFYDGTTTYASISRFDGATLGGFTTDDLAEGLTNLYFTNARARAALSSGTGINYNSSTGVIALSDTGLISSVTAGAGLTGGGSSGNVTLDVGTGYGITVNADSIEVTNTEIQAQANIAIGNNTTDNLTEGATNLYYTTGRANSAITTYFSDSGNAPFSFAGNVDVQGNLNYENVTDLYVTDQKITLNANAASDATVEIIANRPVAGANTKLTWNETTDIWEFTNDGSTFYPMPTSTDDLAEGSTNLYLNGAGTTDDLTEGTTNLYYANSLVDAYLPTYTGNLDSVGNLTVSGIIKTDDLQPIGGDPIAITSARVDDFQISQSGGSFGYGLAQGTSSANDFLIADGTGIFSPTAANTSIVAEGTNLYYTTDRANSAIGAYQGDINTAGNITADYITATTEFIGDLDGAISVGVYNDTASTLTKGQAVYITGSQGDEANVAPANNLVAASMPAMGIIKENISAGSSGQAVTNGTMNFAGHGFTEGAALYVSNDGTLTETIPTGEGELLQKIAKALAPNFILVQGAGRTNATPNLDQGNLFIGDSSNAAVTVTPTNNFVTAETTTLYSNTAVTSVIGQFNAGHSSDVWTLSGHSSQIFADSTQITANSFSDPTLSAYNTNVYYTKWNAAESGYEIYTDAGLTANVSIGGGSYYASPTGQAQTSSTISTPTFELSNALSNINSIATESGSDFTLTSDSKLQLQERIGANDTITNVGNIAGKGYGLTSQGWNFANETFAYTGTDNLDAIFVSGSFTEGSNVFTVAGACTAKNIFVDGLNPGSTISANTNVSTVIGQFNAGQPSDIFTLDGHSSQIFADSTQIIPNSFSDPTLSAYNGNTYYTKWNGIESGYELYTDAGLTANVSIGGSSFYGSVNGAVETSTPVNNTALLTGTVANRLYYNFFLSGGQGYPLKDNAKVVSANTTAVVFDTVASANVTVANASAFGILTGIEDSTTGLALSFLTDNDLNGTGQSN